MTREGGCDGNKGGRQGREGMSETREGGGVCGTRGRGCE